jgi:hypothetical protein
LSEVEEARREWILWLDGLPETESFQRRSHGGRTWNSFRVPLRVIWAHDAEYAEQIASWRRCLDDRRGQGSTRALASALAAAWTEQQAVAALVPEEARSFLPVCGEWALKDLFGHQADWEWVGAQGLRHMAAGRPPQFEGVKDVDAWNQAHVESRRVQS